jgi:uncharacterized membrane protein
MTGTLALLAGLAATWTMVGVIWFVQVVHYPLLAMVGVERAANIAVEHQRRTGQIVGLPMAIEGITTLMLLTVRPPGVFWLWPWLAAMLLAVALGCTVLLSVPLHAQMAHEPTPDVGHRLVRTNWPRTIAWTLRGLVLVVMAVQAWV